MDLYPHAAQSYTYNSFITVIVGLLPQVDAAFTDGVHDGRTILRFVFKQNYEGMVEIKRAQLSTLSGIVDNVISLS